MRIIDWIKSTLNGALQNALGNGIFAIFCIAANFCVSNETFSKSTLSFFFELAVLFFSTNFVRIIWEKYREYRDNYDNHINAKMKKYLFRKNDEYNAFRKAEDDYDSNCMLYKIALGISCLFLIYLYLDFLVQIYNKLNA